MGEHALLSASSAHRWLTCPGSVAMEKGLPETTSEYAEEGTKAHGLAAMMLSNTIGPDGQICEFDDDMNQYVEKYVEQVREFQGDGELMVEKRVDYSDYIGVPDSFGTSDALIISADGEEVTVVDLKYGRGNEIDAENNPQLMLYALGAINEVSVLGYSPKRARMVISQPRLNHLSEWSCTVEELMEFAGKAKSQARIAIVCYDKMPENIKDNLYPGKHQCQWCKAKKICPARTKHITDSVGRDFDDLTVSAAPLTAPTDPKLLAEKMAAIPMIEDWCRAIRAEVEAQLLKGNAIPGYKLVRGKQGNRQWADESVAEETLKQMRLKQEDMYSFKLQSPTAIEKFMKDTPKRWEKLQPLITRKEGAISVAPEDDRRPAVDVSEVGAGFDNLIKE